MKVFMIAEVPHELVELLQNTAQLCLYLKLQPAIFGKSSLDSISQNIQLFVDDPNVWSRKGNLGHSSVPIIF